MQYSAEQQKIVEHHQGSLLVSAAAGSGKTSTLVGHILKRLETEELDRMIILTYTRAAAGEMRQRIMNRLGEQLMDDPMNPRLRRQLFAAPLARIGTIDSFCMRLVQDHFDQLDLPADIRLVEEKQLDLLREELLEDLLEEAYEEGREAFFELRTDYSDEKSHKTLKEMILNLYRVSQNDADPEAWLESCEAFYPEKEEDFLRSPLAREIFEATLEQVKKLARQAGALKERWYGEASSKLKRILEEDEAIFDSLLAADDLDVLLRGIRDCSFSNKPQGETIAGELDRYRGSARKGNGYIQKLKELGQEYRGLKEELGLLRLTKQPVGELIRLTKLFAGRLTERCREKGWMDFSDLEHYALRLLMRKTPEGEWEATPLARELREQYRELIVDEYQDVNQLQEYILLALGGGSLFMVGDIKQSIYRFRRAKPSIFADKYQRYEDDEKSLFRRIDLKENYRSRKETLTGINELFKSIMTPETGGVLYDERVSLHPAASYPGEGAFPAAMLIRTEENAEEGARQQARLIAGEIQRLFRDCPTVYDLKQKKERELTPGDIVILLRTRTRARVFAQVLEAFGIPAAYPHKRGFYERREVRVMLSLLRVLDNPRQDIPLAAVMLSPLGGFSEEDLALLKGEEAGRARLLWDLLGESEEEAIVSFRTRIEGWRRGADYLSPSELIRLLIRESGYETYLKAHPSQGKAANLRELIHVAREFEETQAGSLYQLLHYIERQKELGVADRGEADALEEGLQAVQIDSIHSSKGLEFPVVFLAQAEAGFNQRDNQGDFFTEEETGIALKSVDGEAFIKTGNLQYERVKRKVKKEGLSEEIRLLYVAMTRAKERFYLVGRLKDEEKEMEKLRLPFSPGDGRLPLDLVEEQKSFQGLYLAAKANGLLPHFPMQIIAPEELPLPEEKAGPQSRKKEKEAFSASREESGSMAYPFPLPDGMKAVYAVSEIKARGTEKERAIPGRGTLQPYSEEGETFLREKEGLKAAGKGTVYHKLLEHMPWGDGPREEKVAAFLDLALEKGLFTRKEREEIRIQDICRLFTEEVGLRSLKAFEEGRLWREQPFIISVPYRELDPGADTQETVLVQGIIDMFFEEKGKLILVDYKTDSHVTEQVLKDRHRLQLEYYARGLSQARNQEVSEIYIYSFFLKRYVKL